MRSRDARDVTSAPCALSKLRSREKKKRGNLEEERSGEEVFLLLRGIIRRQIEMRRGKNWDEVWEREKEDVVA